MQDHPTLHELLKGVSDFLEADIIPALNEPLRFHTRVAANLLKIIRREIESERSHISEEGRRLKRLLRKADEGNGSEPLPEEVRALNDELCGLIREGRADKGPWRNEVTEHVRLTLVEKLTISNPRMIEKAQLIY